MGYDAFGLPAENHAISTGQHPRESTEAAIAAFQRQFREWGISIDWSREFGTHEPRYYRWTQWIFLQLFEHGLAYRKEAAVNWCPDDQTVLANEQVIDGRCERCGTLVEVRQLEQWFFRITDYADRLLDDLDTIEWPEHVKTMQRNWIGRSEGAEVTFRCEELGIDYPVFTTRPDTLFGATFFVMAPEHPDVLRLAAGTEHEEEVHEYVNHALTEATEERGDADREKTGVFLGRHVINPVNGERLPMYVADYVLMEYGTGAIMAVPAHDERDHAFAEKFGLPIRGSSPAPDGRQAELPYTGDGPLVNSDPDFDGLPNREALERIVDWLDREGKGHASVNYRLRDWLLSRQRYWGCPIPIIHCDALRHRPGARGRAARPAARRRGLQAQGPLAAGRGRGLGQRDLPARAAVRRGARPTRWTRSSTRPGTSCATATPHNDEAPWDPDVLARWMPVDQYIGGVEHAILHLLYARFFTKALADLGYLDVQEPFARLFTQGMITRDGAKMSKSRGQRRLAADLRRALRRRHRARLHPLHRPARPGRRLVRRGRRGRAPLPRAPVAAERRDRRRRRPIDPIPDELSEADRGAAAQGALGDREGHQRHGRPLRLQHRDRGHHGADQRRSPGSARRAARRPARCASRWPPPPRCCSRSRRTPPPTPTSC